MVVSQEIYVSQRITTKPIQHTITLSLSTKKMPLLKHTYKQHKRATLALITIP